MDITGRIKGIKYKKTIDKDLNKFSLEKFDINSASSTSLIFDKQNFFAVSKWVSPKRTRSYPYERMYDSMHISKKIAVIPIIKDEGKNGDRDFLQWDTVSLMSLLDICVIFAYYSDASANKSGNKITDQKFDNSYVLSKIKEIEDYHSSGLHWNLKELADLCRILDKAKKSYLKIEEKTKIRLHSFDGINAFENKIVKDFKNFMEFSRAKAEKAQNREYKNYTIKRKLEHFIKI
ncbi:MAG: hypothetical protein LBS61_02130 [Endomicrobium sp.]|jgi:hypothetical protein|nr:hypothetical protein [Endomicrobium sp.]